MTLELLREQGYQCQVVERWNQFARKRIDLFGVVDIVAVKDGKTVGVQSTSQGCKSDHLAKIRTEPGTRLWLIEGGNRLVLVTWSKVLVKRGGKRRTWKATETEITKEILETEETETTTE